MDPSKAAHEEWLRLKLDELDAVELRIEAARPKNRTRRRLLFMFLMPVVVGAGVVVSVEPTLLVASLFGLTAFAALTTFVGIVSPHRRLKSLQWRRDEVLGQIEASAARDGARLASALDTARRGPEPHPNRHAPSQDL